MPLTLVRTVPPAAEPLSLAEARAHCRVDGTAEDALLTGLVAAAREWAEERTGRALASSTWRLSLDVFPAYTQGDPWPGALAYFAGGARWLDVLGGGVGVIRLPRPPLVSVSGLTYVDLGGTTQTLAPAAYQVDADSQPGRVLPAYGQVWPVTQPRANAVQVTYAAGYPVADVSLAVAAGSQTVTPGTMQGIANGAVLRVLPAAGAANETPEWVTVTGVTGTTFTATFAAAHGAGWRVCNTPETARLAMKLLLGHWFENREAVGQSPQGPLAMAVDALLGLNWTGEYR